MLEQNREEFELTFVDVWQKDNLGEGTHIVVLDENLPYGYIKANVLFKEYLRDGHDKTGHGSTITAVGYQIAPKAKVTYIPFNSINSEGKELAIQWVIDNKDDIDFITMSLNFNLFTSNRYFDRLEPLGIPFAVASGNESKEDGIGYPAKKPYTIAVGAGLKSVDGYSNGGKELDCVAPSWIYYIASNGNEVAQPGTSISTPYLAYSMLLYMSWRKRKGLSKMTNDDVREFIKTYALDMISKHHLDTLKIGHDYRSGWGLFRLPSEIPKEVENVGDYFNDDNGQWHEEYNNLLAEWGIINGDGKGNFRPNDYITRGELAKVIVETIKHLKK